MIRILAVDDHIDNLTLIKVLLEKKIKGCKVTTETSAKKGLSIAIQQKPDLILLDIVMPIMSGYDICKKLKSDLKTKNIPVIMVTGLGDDPLERIKGYECGADAVIAKPYNIDELTTQIRRSLRLTSVLYDLQRQNQIQKELIDVLDESKVESENRIVQISEYINEFYWETNSDLKITYISRVSRRILGIDNYDIIENKMFLELLPRLNEIDKKTIQGFFFKRKEFKDIDLRGKGNNKRNLWLKASGFPVFDNKQSFKGYRGVCHDISQKKEIESELRNSLEKIKQYQSKLKLLNSRLNETEENQRRMFAEYLHNVTGQTLAIVQMNLSSLLSKDIDTYAKSLLVNSMDLINESIENSRTLTYDLCPPTLYELGLIPALKWKLENIQSDHGIKTTHNFTDDALMFSNEMNSAIYMMLSELLFNVIKHASAKNIILELDVTEKYYIFTVVDDGIGFDPSILKTTKVTKGFGLFNVIERTELLEGNFSIFSKPGSGCKSKISIPLNLTQ